MSTDFDVKDAIKRAVEPEEMLDVPKPRRQIKLTMDVIDGARLCTVHPPGSMPMSVLAETLTIYGPEASIVPAAMVGRYDSGHFSLKTKTPHDAVYNIFIEVLQRQGWRLDNFTAAAASLSIEE